ncbi:MAG: aminoacetone oxidase family FAD-binding enzyme [Lachnospiraceae bacterium]|nr:aminoacetone oxidase family FAD-binding enzyme [Lachnospiraceae bacterium]
MRCRGIIIGGGAAGLMAAVTAAKEGADITLLEHMPRVGKKLLATGNGRCNLSNEKISSECWRCSQEGFPMQVIGKFPLEDTLRFFRSLGVWTRSRGGYLYPASGQAQTVLDALRERVEELGIQVVCECRVDRVEPPDRTDGENVRAVSRTAEDGVRPTSRDKAQNGIPSASRLAGRNRRFLVRTSRGDFFGDFLILAAGSMAARSTGSDGSGYELARQLGHRIKKPLPALVQLRCKGDFFRSVAGVRAEASVRLYTAGKAGELSTLLAEDTGEVQLTDYGLSGIPVFQVSRYAAKALDQNRRVLAVLDFLPEKTEDELLSLLKEQRTFLAGRRAESFLNGLFHKKLAALFLKAAQIQPQAKAGALSERALLRICECVKHAVFEVIATNSFDQAQVCMGGVQTREIDPNTMESRLVPGLYLAGEILDVDGICGGYNLQWAWSSGHVAGASAVQKARMRPE